MTKQILSESTSVPVASGKGRWKATFITPGKGSSGMWLDETIRRDGPIALKKGAKCFVTHNRLENGEPDPFQMWGFLAEDSYYEEGTGLVGEIQVLESFRERVEEVAPHTALSVYIMGESDEQGNIVRILEDVQNGVDLVVHPGRPGSGLVEKLYESAIRDSGNTPSAAPAEGTTKKENVTMAMDADIQNAFDAVHAKIDSLTASRNDEIKGEADAEALAAGIAAGVEEKVVAIKASVEAVNATEGLLPSQTASLLESAYRGEDVTEAIKSAVAFATEARAEFGGGRLQENGRLEENGSTYTLKGFGN